MGASCRNSEPRFAALLLGGGKEIEKEWWMMSGLHRKDDAARGARNLVAQMKGTGWRPIVWENMGWHYKAVSGPVQVMPSFTDGIGDRFWCMIGGSPTDCAGGMAFWTPQRNRVFKDPNRAVRDAMKHVYEFTERISQTVAAAEKAMGK